jgi:four helix bundle protein
MSTGCERPVFDLEQRTFLFARRARRFVRLMPKSICNIEDGKQLVKASGSVGANYIEANEALSPKDFLVRSQICRKEAKESHYWLRLIDLEPERLALVQEAEELTRIFGDIYRKRSS